MFDDFGIYKVIFKLLILDFIIDSQKKNKILFLKFVLLLYSNKQIHVCETHKEMYNLFKFDQENLHNGKIKTYCDDAVLKIFIKAFLTVLNI